MLGEDEHAGPGESAPELERGTEPVIPTVRWHLNVDHRDIGPVRERPAQERLGVSCLGDDVEPGLGEDMCDSLSHQDVILTDYDACRS
jgi:hypothetical protein